MKMLVIDEVKELPKEAREVGTVLCLCSGCGKKIKHKLFETDDKIIIVCPICKLKWEVFFHNAQGKA